VFPRKAAGVHTIRLWARLEYVEDVGAQHFWGVVIVYAEQSGAGLE
jgi:hypothetical protein